MTELMTTAQLAAYLRQQSFEAGADDMGRADPWLEQAALVVEQASAMRVALRLVHHYFESPLSYSEDEMKFLREAVYTNGESLNGL